MVANPIHDAINLHDHSAISKILKADSDQVTVVNEVGESPLHRAVWEGSLDIVALLIDAGGDINAPGPNGDTPLHYAAHEDRPSEIAELLIQRGADIERKNKRGETPLIVAAMRGNDEAANVILSHGASVDLDSAALLGKVDRVRMFLKEDSHLHQLDRPGLLLDLIVRRGQKEIAELLLERGLNPNTGRPSILTAIEMALNDPTTDVGMIRLLLAHGADVNQPAIKSRVHSMVGRFNNPGMSKVLAVLKEYGFAK